MRYVAFAALMLMFAGCSRTEDEALSMERADQARVTYYQAFSRFVLEDDFESISYIFSDPQPVVSLESAEQPESYRFVWLRSFESPLLITVLVEGEQGRLNLREAPAAYGPGTLLRNETALLTPAQLQNLRNVVQSNPFWQEERPQTTGGRDGSVWFVEVKQQGRFYKGQEWEPKQGSPIRAIGVCLLELSRYPLEN